MTTTKPLTRDACITYLQAHGAYAGHSRDGVERLRELVADHQARQAARPEPKADAYSRVKDVPTTDPTAEASADKAERLTLAKAEWKALQAWIASGENPPRPATPNLDALNADNAPAAQGRAAGTPAPAERKPSTRGAAGSGHPRYADAMAAKKARQRTGKGVTDTELADYIAAARKAHPAASSWHTLEVAYWLDGLSVSRPRWNAAWAATEAQAA